MLITLITDASFFQKTHTGGWAAWAKSKRGQVQRAGTLKASPSGPSAAEAQAFANGIAMVLASSIAERGDRIIAQVDNGAVLHRLTGKGRRRMPSVQGPIDLALERLREAGITIEARHIKAHSGTDTPRTFIHDQVDRAARAAARATHQEKLCR